MQRKRIQPAAVSLMLLSDKLIIDSEAMMSSALSDEQEKMR